MKTKTVSLLPNSSAEIRLPIPFNGGTLQVRWLESEDVHALFFNETRLASHHNGFSCHALAKRLVLGDAKRVVEQVEYLFACGGAADSEAIAKATRNPTDLAIEATQFQADES